MFIVWSLIRFTVGSNSHAVSRQEEWSLRKTEEFESEADAKEFVRNAHRRNSEFILLANTLDAITREQFLDEFSFDPKYAAKRQFFIGSKQVIIKQIAEALAHARIDVKWV